MKILKDLANKKLVIDGIGEADDFTRYIQKFLIDFYKQLLKEIFTRQLPREDYSILQTDYIHISANDYNSDLYIIFVKESGINKIEYFPVVPMRDRNIVNLMIHCEFESGDVTWGIKTSFENIFTTDEATKFATQYLKLEDVGEG